MDRGTAGSATSSPLSSSSPAAFFIQHHLCPLLKVWHYHNTPHYPHTLKRNILGLTLRAQTQNLTIYVLNFREFIQLLTSHQSKNYFSQSLLQDSESQPSFSFPNKENKRNRVNLIAGVYFLHTSLQICFSSYIKFLLTEFHSCLFLVNWLKVTRLDPSNMHITYSLYFH